MHTDVTPENDGISPETTENEHRIKLAPVPLFTVMILLMLLCFTTRELDKGLSISSSSYIKDVGKYLFIRLRCIVLYISVISYSVSAVITAVINKLVTSGHDSAVKSVAAYSLPRIILTVIPVLILSHHAEQNSLFNIGDMSMKEQYALARTIENGLTDETDILITSGLEECEVRGFRFPSKLISVYSEDSKEYLLIPENDMYRFKHDDTYEVEYHREHDLVTSVRKYVPAWKKEIGSDP